MSLLFSSEFIQYSCSSYRVENEKSSPRFLIVMTCQTWKLQLWSSIFCTHESDEAILSCQFWLFGLNSHTSFYIYNLKFQEQSI